MASKYENSISVGDRFGYWTVTGSPYTDNKGRAKVSVACDCGYASDVHVYNLVSGKSTQCKTCARGKSPTFYSVKNHYAYTAAGQDVDFSLTANDLSESYIAQSATCMVTGNEIPLNDAAISLWNSDQGYTANNTVWIAKEIKTHIENGMDMSTFDRLAREYVSHFPDPPQTNDPIEDFFNRRENDDE